MRVIEMEHHSIANQPSFIATLTFKHMTVTDYLITAHLSAQQQYYQQYQEIMEELSSSANEITTLSTKNIHKQV